MNYEKREYIDGLRRERRDNLDEKQNTNIEMLNFIIGYRS